MKNPIIILSACLVILAAGYACKKDQPTPGKAQYNLRMTDAPGPYSEVNIDLQSIEITGPGNGAVMLNVNAGIYNLLDFANGLDTLIGTGTLNAGTISQIRLILGPNNSVKINGTLYPLSTPSAMQSGLKLQVHQQLLAGVAYYILLDFDANQSVVEQGNGSYALKPVIRTISTAMSGAIKGQVSPAAAATITAVSGSNIYTATTNANGNFLLQGLPAGTYIVTVAPIAPYNGVTLNNISVSVGSTTQLGIIHI